MSNRKGTSSLGPGVRPVSNDSEGYYNDVFETSMSDPGSRLSRASGKSDQSLNRRPNHDGHHSRSTSQTPVVPELKKGIGLVSAVSLIVGTMVGSGIFISPAGVATGAGSVGLSLILWLVCGIISLIGSLCYAELGTTIPLSGGEYSYLREAFGHLHHGTGSVIAFLFIWINTVVLKPASVAIISLTFAKYCLEPFYDVCTAPMIAQQCLAALCVLVLTIVNCTAVRLAMILHNVMTVAKLLAMVLIVMAGFVIMGLGYTQHLSTGFTGTSSSAGKIAISIYHGMWAYDGWNNLNYVTEELIDGNRILPKAIAIAIPLVTATYVLVNISYFAVMSVSELVISTAVAVTWGNRLLGVMAWVIPLAVAMSTFGAANGTLFSTGRLPYVAARNGHMVKILSYVHCKRFTPLPSLVFTGVTSILYIIWGHIDRLIEFFSFAVWFFYGATMLALIIMRFTQKDRERPFQIPIVFPFFILIVALFLVVAPIADNPRLEYLYAFLIIIAGLIFYVPFVYFQKEIPGMARFTAFCQLLFQCGPQRPSQNQDNMHTSSNRNISYITS